MKLKEVYISGYKSYGLVDEPIQFEDINIIIGANGAGKSNFISFLEMIAFIAKDDFSDYVAGSGYAASLIHARRERIDHIKGKLVFTGNQNRDEYSITIKMLSYFLKRCRFTTTPSFLPFRSIATLLS